MSILYCSIPDFATALVRRDDPSLAQRPLVLIDPEQRVFAASLEATACGVVVGQAVRAAEVRCPEARLLEADITRCGAEFEALLQLLERTSPSVEPHGWGAAYVDWGSLARQPADALTLCQELGQSVRQELGQLLQPALGWDSTKFTAQAAAQRTRPGHVRAVAAVRERAFLRPLPVVLLPLDKEALLRLGFLGLRTLGQYAVLPTAAVWQQFGRAGRLAQRCARGEDDRQVVPRWREQRLMARYNLEDPLADQGPLLAVLQRLLAPLLAKLRDNLQTCGRVQLTVRFADGSAQRRERTLLYPTAEQARVLAALQQFLVGMHWPAGATGLEVVLERIQDVVAEQLPLFAAHTERERKLREAQSRALCEVQQYVTARFGANRLRRAVLAQPGAPLPEWRVGWLEEGQ